MIMGRPPCCDKANVKRGLWTAEEDAKILAYVANHGIGNWTQVPKKAGLNRCGKSCRLRWTNYLRPDLKHEEFTEQEEQLIVQFHAAIGSRWSLIAKQLPGRTDNDVKNYWNTKLKKKLIKMNIDPITHKPFSQIFSDFESISCLTTNHKNLPNSVSSQSKVTSSIFSGNPSGNIGRLPMLDRFHNNNSFANSCLTHQMSQLEVQENGCFDDYKLEVVSPSSSSSSSSSIATGKSAPALVMPGSCDWGDKSFNNPLPVTDIIEDEYNFQKFLETDTSNLNCANRTNGVTDNKSVGTSDFIITGESTELSNCYEPSSSVSSFVKALLDRDSEMQLDFPVFDDILDY